MTMLLTNRGINADKNAMNQALIYTFYAFGNRMLSTFVKIMQSFILMQNT